MSPTAQKKPGSKSRVWRLTLLPETLAICRLPCEAWPERPGAGDFFAAVSSPDGLTVICSEGKIPSHAVKVEPDWRALMVTGPLDFSLVGVIADLSVCLAEAGVSLFALSSYDNDYLLIKESDLPAAAKALVGNGHKVA